MSSPSGYGIGTRPTAPRNQRAGCHSQSDQTPHTVVNRRPVRPQAGRQRNDRQVGDGSSLRRRVCLEAVASDNGMAVVVTADALVQLGVSIGLAADQRPAGDGHSHLVPGDLSTADGVPPCHEYALFRRGREPSSLVPGSAPPSSVVRRHPDRGDYVLARLSPRTDEACSFGVSGREVYQLRRRSGVTPPPSQRSRVVGEGWAQTLPRRRRRGPLPTTALPAQRAPRGAPTPLGSVPMKHDLFVKVMVPQGL